MDYILDILVPKKDIDKLGIEEMFVEWGGEEFSQDPKKFKYQTTLFFQEHKNLKYYEKILKADLKLFEFVALTLRGDSLSNLEFMVNRNKNYRLEENELINFIYKLYKVIDIFCILLLLNEDQIDEQYNIVNDEEAIKIFTKSLKWESPKGIIISKGM